VTAMTIIGRWQQEAAGFGAAAFPAEIYRPGFRRARFWRFHAGSHFDELRSSNGEGRHWRPHAVPTRRLSGGPDSIPVGGSARHTPRWPSQRPPSPTNTIRRTGRLLTPSTLVSSSTLPARPPQPSWRMRAMMSRMRMAPRFSVPR
jgi:hypothetical protein